MQEETGVQVQPVKWKCSRVQCHPIDTFQCSLYCIKAGILLRGRAVGETKGLLFFGTCSGGIDSGQVLACSAPSGDEAVPVLWLL